MGLRLSFRHRLFAGRFFGTHSCGFFLGATPRFLGFSLTLVLALRCRELFRLALFLLLACAAAVALMARAIHLFLLMPRLFLQHTAVEIRLLGANFDVHRSCTALRRRDFDFALRLAFESDLAWRAAGFLFSTMRSP